MNNPRRIAILIILLVAALCGVAAFMPSCSPELPVTGWLTYKKYTPEHMCHSEPEVVGVEGAVVVHPVIVQHHHHKVEAEFLLYLAVRENLYVREVNQYDWQHAIVGQKMTFPAGTYRRVN